MNEGLVGGRTQSTKPFPSTPVLILVLILVRLSDRHACARTWSAMWTLVCAIIFMMSRKRTLSASDFFFRSSYPFFAPTRFVCVWSVRVI